MSWRVTIEDLDCVMAPAVVELSTLECSVNVARNPIYALGYFSPVEIECGIAQFTLKGTLYVAEKSVKVDTEQVAAGGGSPRATILREIDDGCDDYDEEGD